MSTIVLYDSGHVPLYQLADQAKTDRGVLRRFALKEGFQFVKMRTEESRGHLVLALSVEDARRLIERRKSLGFRV